MSQPVNTPVPVAIRRCTIEDTEVLADLARSTFSDTFSGTCTDDDMEQFLNAVYNEGKIRHELQDPGYFTFFGMINDQPAGFLSFATGPLPYEAEPHRRPLELNRLYVKKEYQGHGVAKQLLDYYLGYARKHDYNYCWLGVWEHNYRAQKFYGKHGFTFTGHTHPFPIGNTPRPTNGGIEYYNGRLFFLCMCRESTG